MGLAAVDGSGGVHGVLPLVQTRGLPVPVARSVTGRRLASLPRTPLAGPLGDDDGAVALLVGAAIDRTPRGAQLQLKSASEGLHLLDERLVCRPWRRSYVVDLGGMGGLVRFGNARNHSRIRWAVNKARREGVSVREATSPDDVRTWYRLYLMTMRHHVVPPRPLRLFEAMWDLLRPAGMLRLLLAERGGTLLAGSVVVTMGRTAFYLFNGVRRDAFALRPNDVLQWHLIHDAADAGVECYDLGEVVSGASGLAEFKHKWGSRERMLDRYYFPAPEPAGAPDDRRPGERSGGLVQRGWQHVPLPVTAAVGERLYGFL